MSTLADLIRAHQANPRTLYVAPETDKTSQPGSYDQSASQRSPALDRRIEKQLARRLGEDRGLDPDDLDKIDDFEDLNDLLNGDDPDLRDPEDPEKPDPEDLDLPDPEDPDTPDLPVEPPVMGYGTAYALHSGSISKTEDGGAKWANYPGSPGSPIGFSIVDGDGYVATSSGVFYGDSLTGWRELTMGNQNIQISGFANGGFEEGMTGWETIDGDSPRTGWVETVIPSEGVSYLRRDWVTYTDGEFTVGQGVTLTPAEMSALDGGDLSFSGDVFCKSGASAELRIERFAASGALVIDDNDRLLGDEVHSHFLDQWSIECIGLPSSSVTRAQIIFRHNVWWDYDNQIKSLSDPTNIIDQVLLRLTVMLTIAGVGDVEYTAADIRQDDIQAASAVLRFGQVRQPLTLTLTSSSRPGSIVVKIPVGWGYPIDTYIGGGTGYTMGGISNGRADVGYTSNSWQVLARASGSEFTWNRIEARLPTLPPSYNEIRCVIEVTGSPADAYVDNCRLEIIRDSTDMEVHAIGGEYVAINDGLYKMSPTGLAFDRALEFTPTGISADGSIAWGGGSIFIREEEATYTLPYTIVKAFPDPTGPVLFLNSGEIWRRRNDPDYPGWDTLGTLSGPIVDIASADGAYIAISDPAIDLGSLRTSRDLASWRIVSTTSYGNRVVSMGMTVMTWTTGSPQVYWFDTSGWHTAGNLKSGILDISAG